MAYYSKTDLRIDNTKLITGGLYVKFIIVLGFVLFSLGACSSQYETAKRVTVVKAQNPVKKIDSLKGGLMFRSPIKINSVKKCK